MILLRGGEKPGRHYYEPLSDKIQNCVVFEQDHSQAVLQLIILYALDHGDRPRRNDSQDQAKRHDNDLPNGPFFVVEQKIFAASDFAVFGQKNKI